MICKISFELILTSSGKVLWENYFTAVAQAIKFHSLCVNMFSSIKHICWI